MKIHLFLPCALFMFALLFCLAGTPTGGLPKAYAANAAPPAAKKAPVAQKPPVARAQPTARPKVTPRQNPAFLTGFDVLPPPKPAVTAKKQAPAPSVGLAAPEGSRKGSTDDKLKNALDIFAKDCISRMNKERRPGINAKEVKRQPDGSYTARYMAVDPDSLETSYNPTENNKTVLYIGRMNYHEVEYISMGTDQKQALAGPFNENNRTPITELIKYKAGKWTY